MEETGDDRIVGLTTNDYETQYFGFTPKSFSDGINTAMHAYVGDAIQQVQEYLQKEFDLSEEELSAGSQMIFTSMTRVLDKASDKLETYVAENTFHLPSNVVLPEDRVQLEFDGSTKDLEKVEQDIKALEEKIKNVKYVNAALRQEIDDSDEVQEYLEKQLEYFKSIQSVIKESSLKESLTFANENLQKLKKSVESFEVKSPDPQVRVRKIESDEYNAAKCLKMD